MSAPPPSPPAPPGPPGAPPTGAGAARPPGPPEDKRVVQGRKVLESCLQLARAAEPHLFVKGAFDWFEKLDLAHQNTALSLQFALVFDLPRGLALSSLLWRYWVVRGHITLVRPLVDQMLERATTAGAPPEARLPAAVSAAFMAYFAGDDARAEKLAEEFLPVAQKRQDQMREAQLQLLIGWGEEGKGAYAPAKERLQAALERFRALSHHWGIAVTLAALGELARLANENESAKEIFDEAFKAYQRLGDHQGMAVSLINLGFVALQMDDLDDARGRFLGGIQILQNLGSHQFVAAALFGMACLKLAEAQFSPCARLLGASQNMLEQVGGKLEPTERALWEQVYAAVVDRLGEEVVLQGMAEGRKIAPERLIQ